MPINIRGFDFRDRLFSDPSHMRQALANTTRVAQTQAHPREMYDLLRAYYEQTSLYEILAANLHTAGVWQEGVKALRNPAFRAVEYHVATLWSGATAEAFKFETDNTRLEDAVRQVWAWSNWGSQKQVASRWLATYGDLFIKVCQRPDRSRVFFQLLNPGSITDMDTDERGFLTYIRIDVPQIQRTNDVTKRVWITEVWSKELQSYRTWTHQQTQDTDLTDLGAPEVEQPLSAFGIDFVPIVQMQFRDIGEPRGVGCFTNALDKIDEANRQATRLYQMLFRSNKETWVLSAGGVDANNRPLPPVQLGNPTDTTITIEDQTIISLPGQSTLTSLVPQLDYAAALSILQDHMHELEQDLPELAYYRVIENANASGRAIRTQLTPAIARTIEARGNAESGLIRLDMMALTMGAESPLFTTLGSFEDGDFEHTFTDRPVVPTDTLEDAQEELAKAQAAILKLQFGVSKEQLQREAGYTDDEIAQMLEENSAAQESLGSALLAQFDSGIDPTTGQPMMTQPNTPPKGVVPPQLARSAAAATQAANGSAA